MLGLIALAYGALDLTLDVDRDTLGRSLAGEVGTPYYLECTGRSGGRWECSVGDNTEDGRSGSYALRRTHGRCWRARLTTKTNRLPSDAHGCVDVWEQISNFEGFGNERYD